MLYNRIYKPKENDLIYHYCSAETFHAICTNKTIRLCDIFSMNDYMEMHWGYSIWEKVASNLVDTIGYKFIDSIDQIIHESGRKCLVLASCFSLDRDVLSQWRAYSNDGNGYCVGFKAKELLNLSIKPLKVEYNESKQMKELTNIVKALNEVEQNLPEDEQYGNNFINTCANIAFDLAAFKNPAFSEEKEIRLIHLLNFKESNSSLKLVDSGGTYFGKPAEPIDVKFLISQNAPKTYIDIEFTNNGTINPIQEVLIGPKNQVLNSAISVFLETLAIGNVGIKRSKSSYR